MRNKIIVLAMFLLFVQLAFALITVKPTVIPITPVNVTKINVTNVTTVNASVNINIPTTNVTVLPINTTIHVYNFTDNDSIPVLQLSIGATPPIANKKFSIVVSATDDKGVAMLRLLLSTGWQNFPCNNQLSCHNEFFTSEQNLGTYNYKAMVVDNAQKVAVDSVTVVLSQACSENWVKNNNPCQSNDQKFISYNEATGCLIPKNKPADNGTYASCDYCTPSLTQHLGLCMLNDSLTKWYSDSSNCFAQTGLASDKVPADQYQSCDYCAPNLQIIETPCTFLDLKTKTYNDLNSCFAKTGLASDRIPNDEPLSCDYCTPNVQTIVTACNLSDVKVKGYNDLNGCFALTGLQSDKIPNNELLSCDYCAPNWQPQQGTCKINDTMVVSFYDIYGCFAQTGLPSDNNVPANQTGSCDYCTPDIKSTTGACTTNDTQLTHYYDTRSCFGQTGLPSDTVPADQYAACDYCTPALVEHNTTCAITDSFTKYYTDSNTCFALTGLNSDKVPNNQSLSCDYCTPNWQPQNTTCINGNMTKYYVDANGCFGLTGLPSDNNKPANETASCTSPGYLAPYIVLPNQSILISGTTLVNQSKNITIRTGVKCVGGPCKNVTAALDPTAKVTATKITKPVIILSANLIQNVKQKPRTVIIEFRDENFSLNDKVQSSRVKANQDRTIKMLNTGGQTFKVKYKYALVNAMAGEINSRGLQKLLNDPSVAAVYEDFVGRGSVTQGKETLGLDHLNNFIINGKNLTGKNYSICLIDSGVNYNHESLGGGGYPNSKVIGGWNFVHNISDVYDLNGHGTKMSGILAGNGTVRGVAPDAYLVEAVVLNETNWYVGSKAYAAMDWCYANRANYSIAAVSMSFGDSIMNNATTCPSYFNAPLRNLNLAGIILAAASGNEWFNQGIAYPSCSPYVIGVGAMDDGRYFGAGLNNTITNFTNIGFGMNLLMAPGRGIGTTDRDTGTSSCTGTSCSTPFIAAGGLLLNQYLVEKYNRTINNPKMFGLLNSTGRQVPMEDTARYNGTFTLPYFDEALNRFEVPQHKGLVSTVVNATPFYTRQQNPVSCGDMAENQVCESQWNVTATGIVGTYEFFTIYTSDNSTANTTKFNVTII
ncbi:MAG: S8 family serine peptidase [Candidatus Micrarchaeota archaeon]